MPPLTRGPLPARVYWRRRMLLLSMAVLLVVGIARLLDSGSDASEPQARQAAAETSSGTSSGASAGVSPGAIGQLPQVTGIAGPGAGRPGRHRTSAAPVLAAPDGPCRPSDIEVTATVK